MTNQEIIEIATKVYGECDWHESALFHLEAFAKLVAAKERERVIAMLEALKPLEDDYGYHFEPDREYCIKKIKEMQ